MSARSADSPTLPGLELRHVHLDEYAIHRDPAVRWSDPATSRVAAEIEPVKLSALMATILELYDKYGPMTDDELGHRYRLAGHPPRTRQRLATTRGELVRLGHVRDSGASGRSALGNAAVIWALEQ